MTGWPALLGGLGLVAVLFGLLSAGIALFQPVTDLSWIGWNLAIGVLLLAASLLFGFDTVRQRIQSGEARRVGRYGSSAVVSAVSWILILGMLGFLAQRRTLRFDWSEGDVNTLTEQTADLLGRLDADTEVTAFFARSEIPAVAALLDLYDYQSDRLAIRYVDPNAAPLLVEELALEPEALARGLVRISQASGGMVVTDLTESGLTNGLLRLTRGLEKKIYFIRGHGERAIESLGTDEGEAAEGMSRAVDALRNETYQVESLDLSTRGEIPQDAEAVVVSGPTRPFFEHELAALLAYAERGGSLFILVDPRANTNLGDLLEGWGVYLGDDVVVDPVQAIFNQATVPMAAEYAPDHPITQSLRQATVYPMVRSVDATQEGWEALVLTGPSSWAERDLAGWQASGRAEFGDGDLDGPVPIAVAGSVSRIDQAENRSPGRVVVFGDSDFVSNEFIEAQYNRDIFLNSANWLLGDIDQISIRPRLSRASRFEMNADQFRAIVSLSLFVLPEGIAVAGVLAWWLRRGRGGR